MPPRVLVLACLLALALPAAALADPADLDGSFTTSGVTTISSFGAAGYAEDVARQPDGKLVVVGAVQNGGVYDWGITRLNADGGMDGSYGGGGTQTWSEGGQLTGATDVAVESGGTIDVVGDSAGSPAKIDLFRFSSTGTVAGHALVDVTGATNVTGQAVAVQPDGKVVVAGTIRSGAHNSIFVARFNTNTTIDTTFDNDGGTADGIVRIDSAACDGASGDCAADSLALVTSGGNVTGIYVGGEAENVDPGGRILRLKPTSGSFGLDSAYGSAGIVKIPPQRVANVRKVLVQDDGKTVALGDASTGSGTSRCGAVRRLDDGTPDLGFGSSGQVALDGGGQTCSIDDASLGSDGRVTFAGSRVASSSPTQVLGRLTASGSPDETFAPGGLAVAPVGGRSFAYGLSVLGDGRIVTAGGTGSPESFFAARYQGGERSSAGGGGGGGAADPGTGTPPAATPPAAAPKPLSAIGYRSNTDGSPVTRARAGQAIACDPGAWSGDPGFAYAWLGVPRGGVSETLGTSRVVFLDAAAIAKYQYVFCEVYATNALGAKLAGGGFLPTVAQIAMPDVTGLSVPEAKQKISKALGAVTFAKVTRADGFAKDVILCEYGGTKPYKGECPAAKKGKIRPGDVFGTDPNGGRVLDVDGASPVKVSFSYYEPAKDAGNDVAPADTKRWGDDCPLRTGKADDERDLENRLLGKPAPQARDTLTKLECPFEEHITKRRGIEAQDPYVESVRAKSLDAGRGFVLEIVQPQFDDLAIAPYYVRLHGRDSYQGANLEKGPLNPGIGTDGKLTKTLGGQDNDVCFRVIEASTGRAVEGATVTGIDPDGNPLGARDGIYLKPMRKRTDRDGEVCGSVDLHSTGSARVDASYAGANGVTEDGSLSIPVADRGRTEWQTVDGRRVQCKGTCDQLGFSTASRRAHAANVLDDIGRALKGIVDRIFGADQARAELAGGDTSVSLYQARRKGGIEAGFLALGGTLKPSLAPAGLITNDGGSLITNDGGSLITNDGGSLITNDGGSLITNDGGSLITNDGGSIVAQGGGNLITNDGGSRRAVKPGVVIVAAGGGRVLAGAALGLSAEAGGVVLQIGNRNVIFRLGGTLAPGTIIRTGAGNRMPTLPSEAIGLDPMKLAASVKG
jgi:uncharacterized delta-60 repeat protein